MADPFKADGARVLADLNTLRAIGAYKSGVHRPTFSEPHIRSLNWLAQRLPDAGLTLRRLIEFLCLLPAAFFLVSAQAVRKRRLERDAAAR